MLIVILTTQTSSIESHAALRKIRVHNLITTQTNKQNNTTCTSQTYQIAGITHIFQLTHNTINHCTISFIQITRTQHNS